MKITKSGLAIELSKLEDFKENIVELEQYSTPSEIAAEMLWDATLKGDITGKVIVDPACGPGFLGLGALLLGAKKVVFIDISKEALEIAKRNYEKLTRLEIRNSEFPACSKTPKGFLTSEYEIGEALFVEADVECLKQENSAFLDEKVSKEIEVVVENPPFGTKKKHADKLFLESIFALPNVKAVYTLHKATSKKFIEAISKDYGFLVTHYKEFDFKLRATQKFHTRKLHEIKVGLWRLEKKV